jgi:hypothetical protein
MLQISFRDMEEISVTVEKTVFPESRRWAMAVPVPIEVDETVYATAALNPTGHFREEHSLKIAATQTIHSSGKVKILGFNALKDREETLRMAQEE